MAAALVDVAQAIVRRPAEEALRAVRGLGMCSAAFLVLDQILICYKWSDCLPNAAAVSVPAR